MKCFSKFFSVFYAAFFINIFLIALTVLFFVLHLPVLAVACFILWLGVMLFFRDPERTIPTQAGVLLSSADGKVVKIEQSEHPDFDGRVNKVLIFMSPLDVHRNRTPIAGKVERVVHTKGSFRPAFEENMESVNERNSVLFVDGNLRVIVTQIAGILARRIVCRLKGGETVAVGEQFGLIRFGSANEIVFPASYEVEVAEGERVLAGESIIARKVK